MLALIALLAIIGAIFGAGVLEHHAHRAQRWARTGDKQPVPGRSRGAGTGRRRASLPATPIISDAEEFRRNAHLHLRPDPHTRARTRATKSWMEEPGAMEAAGLVDRAEPPSAEGHPRSSSEATDAPNSGAGTT